MTAIYLIVGSTSAYLVADQGAFHHDGTLLDIQSKIVSTEKGRMAVAASGRVSNRFNNYLANWLGTCSTQQEALARLPEFVEAHEAVMAADDAAGIGQMSGPIAPLISLFVACWSAETGPAAYIIGNEGAIPPPYVARSLKRVDRASLPSMPIEALQDGILDRRAIMQAMDALRSHPKWRGAPRVGGAVELATVSVLGLQREILAEWPDKIGSRIVGAGDR